MTRESLLRVRGLLDRADDAIYHDVHDHGGSYSNDELELSKTLDQANQQITTMLAQARTT